MNAILRILLLWAGFFSLANAQWVVTLPAVARVAEPLIGPVVVLLPPGQSPHHWALRPSQLKQLSQAEGVVLVSPLLEQPVYRWLMQHDKGAKTLVWSQLDGVVRLSGGHAHHHHEDRDHEKDEAHMAHINTHLWLSPHNARILMQALAAKQGVPVTHLHQVQVQLDKTVEQVRQLLAPVRQRPFLVLHDAFAYFEHDFGLNKAGVVEGANGDIGVKRLLAMRTLIEREGIRCIVYPAHRSPRLLQRLVKGLDVKLQPLDALGWQQTHYNDWLIALAKGYRACLTY